MFRGTRPQALGDFPAIDFLYLPVVVEYRYHERAAKVFMTGLPHQAHRLQPGPDSGAGFQLFLRQAVSQGSVGKAELKTGD
ncbi:hypothetical protein Ppb6_00002 [Photorhabdus australis subsp. thailandensis]|uniref:Uncharacterized protein n=1 Tax=Photorhabdus australis subsp. thailandensis TaxID=2805096 RepID=A0A1C0UA10_9GAMM|nr:hypothetical protein Ppb6_00002 [Photorhabdus australis subsp. thailandensis]